MSDNPFFLDETPPPMTPEQAVNVGRAYKGLADHLASLGARGTAAGLERSAQWWLTYAIALGQTKSS